MIIESPEALKEWLTTVLEPMCEADPTALAKYVIALVKKDKPVAELRDTCLDQLDVFLQQETKPFVELLFKTLDNRSYLVRADAPATTIAQPTPLQLDPTPQMVAPPSGMAVISNSVAMSIATPALPNSTGSASGSKLPERRSSHPDAAVDGEDRDKQLSQAKVSSSSHTRSRSRSRSRNKSRSRSREREDRRRGRFYGEEERRRGGIVRRHDRYNSYRRDRSRERMERNRERERERDRERKRSRSRSPSRSKSRSKSRSRSRSKDKARQRPDGQKVQNSSTANQDHGDTDYRFGVPPPTALGTLSSSQNSSSIVAPVPPPGGSLDPQVAYSGRNARRCRDYDEKGVCLRGDLCPYDHGNDPVVVEEAHLPSMLAYGPNSTSTSTQIPPGPGPGPRPPGPHPGPIPPLLGPPMSHQRPLLPQPMSMMQPMGSRMFHPMSDPYVPEPYNPEAPAMDRLPPRIRPPFWGPRMGPGRMHGMRPPHQYPHPTRELINVPTVDDTSTPSESADHASTNSNRTVVLPQKRPLNEPQGPPPLPLRVFSNVDNAPEQQQQHQQQQPQQQQQQQQQPPAKGRVFDYTRLGGRKFNLENAVLELRKIPQGLNSITQLNNHFRRFGRIVNLQVCYEGDPEAALIQFSSHAEAHAAYRSTEAVLNNRFIKVFWHNQNKDDASQPLSWPNNVSVVKKLSAKERLGLPLQKSSVNESNVPPPEEVEKSSVTLATSGTLSKTVFNLAALKKSNVSTISPSVPPAAMKTHQAVAAKETIKKKQEEQRKEAMKINVDLQKRKQELIQKQIQQQKILIEKLEKNKNLTVVEKTTIMTTLKLLQESIEKLKMELVASATLQTTSHPKTKQEAQREILDIEMELYAKQHQGGDTTELRKKVADLKQEALSLGLIDSKFPLGRGRGLTRRLVRGASSAFRGRGRLAGARSLDHRPRTLQVMGFEDSEKEEVVAHLSNFGDIENLDVDESGSKLVVSYRNRREAETAALQGAKFKGRVLMMVWHQVSGAHGANDGHDGLADGLTGDEELLEQETENEDLLLGDDDEEEDSEARSWRR